MSVKSECGDKLTYRKSPLPGNEAEVGPDMQEAERKTVFGGGREDVVLMCCCSDP